jgi:hypothetical protein
MLYNLDTDRDVEYSKNYSPPPYLYLALPVHFFHLLYVIPLLLLLFRPLILLLHHLLSSFFPSFTSIYSFRIFVFIASSFLSSPLLPVLLILLLCSDLPSSVQYLKWFDAGLCSGLRVFGRRSNTCLILVKQLQLEERFDYWEGFLHCVFIFIYYFCVRAGIAHSV